MRVFISESPSSKLVFATGLVISFFAGCRESEPAIQPLPTVSSEISHGFHLADVTASTGVNFRYQNGQEAGHHSLLEWVGGGVAMIDYDLDRHLDLFFPGGGSFREKTIIGAPAALYRNFGDWKFVNVTENSNGFASPWFSHGCEVGDFNNDGFSDALVTGYGGLRLFCNQGDGTFDEISETSGLTDRLWSTSAAWGDFNCDGNLDLYVCHYLDWSFDNHPKCAGPEPGQVDACAPKRFSPLPDVIYYSDGAGGFRDTTAHAGLRPDGKGLGVMAFDADGDADTDVYVANDTTANFLYLNDGVGRFEEAAWLHGVAGDLHGDVNGSMGVDAGDYNRDGRFDIWVTNYVEEDFALYRNEGAALFRHVSQSTGVSALGGLFVGFGTGFVDCDLDGDEDLVAVNGHVLRYPPSGGIHQRPLFLENVRGARFERRIFPKDTFFDATHLGRGLAIGDLDQHERDGSS